MKIFWKDIIAAQEAIDELARIKGLGARLSAICGRNDRLYRQAFKDYEMARMRVLDEHGESVKDRPGEVRVPPEKITLFVNEMKELDNSEVEVDFHKISFKDVEARNVELSPMVYSALHFLFEGAPDAP